MCQTQSVQILHEDKSLLHSHYILIRKRAEKEIVHTPEEYDFPDSLYQEHWEKAEAYGIVSDSGDLLACIEVCPEEWSNRLMVTELWVSDELRNKAIQHKNPLFRPPVMFCLFYG